MSIIRDGPEAHNSLFASGIPDDTPEILKRAAQRIQFTPSYVIVGVYRLFTDRTLSKPVWDKTKHGLRRGTTLSLVWGVLTFGIQRAFVAYFMSKSPRVTGLADDTFFGYQLPFSLISYATVTFIAAQATMAIRFFLSRNLRIARDRVWDQSVASRGKGPDFWKPYVEEWDHPPVIKRAPWWQRVLFGNWVLSMIIRKVVFIPFGFIPVIGIVIPAWFKGLGMARILHRRYFEAKGMTDEQVAVFMEERKWDYRAFGFTAALLEGLPLIGLVFSVSNRIGAAMWAHDLEKMQHFHAQKKRS
ncbi:hypothetical protein CYLTODRAFT_416649 [Cylindrobasidium torrendii FP15055 ss-10]|uniref:Uncharacterized protein n=1 Tax=Cylindrobasidium torrendii FP15055 ss-10 TaxID=1314674 RepID=A0A0D7BUZ4_9AGAR|nr:hypothetical protein CYLTODRAFT_416649 [Cylindrobasidium torrendii FP15055 ss-10]